MAGGALAQQVPCGAAEPNRTHGRYDGLLIAAAALALCLGLTSPSSYGDGPFLLDGLEAGDLAWSNHVLFMPALQAWCRALHALGLSFATGLELAAAAGVAVAAWAVHRATLRLVHGRARRAAVALLVVTTPAVLAFGTVIELHGPFCGCAGLAFLACARAVARPGPGAALVLGLATGVATGMHSTGHLLLVLLWLLLLVERGRARALADGALAAAAHFAVLVAATLAFRSGPVLTELFTQHALTKEQFPLARLGRVAWRTARDEWLVPFLPLSLAPLLALGARAQRPVALVTLLSLASYLALTTRVLKGAVEHGAYLLPLAFPAALLTARALRPRLALAVAAGALALAIPFTLAVQERELNAPRSEQVEALAGGAKVAAIVTWSAEAGGFRKCDPQTPMLWVEDLVKEPRGDGEIAARLDLAYRSVTALGRELWLTPRARQRLEHAQEPQVRAFWNEHLLQRYRLVGRRARGGLVWVVTRP